MGQICSFCGSNEEPSKSSAFADTSTSSDIPESQHHSQQHPHSSSSSPFQQNADGTAPALNNRNANNPSTSQHDHDHLLGSNHADPSSTHEGMEQIDENERQRRLKQYQLEQAELARREAIVNTASQSMVPVGGSQGSGAGGAGGMMNHSHLGHHRGGGGGGGGGGGINTYYDPAYAAAAAQDILNSAARSGGMMFAEDAATRAAWAVSVMGVMPVPSKGVASSKDVMESLGRGRWDGIKLGSRGSGVAGCGGEDPEYYLDDLAEAFLETMVPTKTTLFGGCPPIVENLP